MTDGGGVVKTQEAACHALTAFASSLALSIDGGGSDGGLGGSA
jgi:hypothetical protein